MPPEAVLLKAEAIEAGYGTMQVLWGIDLDVRAGETVLLLGTNGAGKTTFLKSLVGLVEARRGSVKLGGEDVTRLREEPTPEEEAALAAEAFFEPEAAESLRTREGAEPAESPPPAAKS